MNHIDQIIDAMRHNSELKNSLTTDKTKAQLKCTKSINDWRSNCAVAQRPEKDKSKNNFFLTLFSCVNQMYEEKSL